MKVSTLLFSFICYVPVKSSIKVIYNTGIEEQEMILQSGFSNTRYTLKMLHRFYDPMEYAPTWR